MGRVEGCSWEEMQHDGVEVIQLMRVLVMLLTIREVDWKVNPFDSGTMLLDIVIMAP